MFRLIILLLLASIQAHGQDPGLDSLQRVYAGASHDSSRVHALIQLAKAYQDSHPDTANHLASQGLAMAKQSNFLQGQADALHIIGMHHYLKGQYLEAAAHYDSAAVLYELLDHKHGMTANLDKLALLYKHKGQPFKAMQTYLRAIELRTELEEWAGVADAWENIGDLQLLHGNLEDAKRAFFTALGIYHNISAEALAAGAYANLAQIHLHAQHADSAKYYFDKARKMAFRKGDHEETVHISLLYARFYEQRRSYNDAIALLKDTEDRVPASSTPIKRRLLQLKKAHGHLLLLQRRESEAIALLQEVFDAGNSERLVAHTDMASTANLLAKAYMGLGQQDKAQQYAEQAISFSQRPKSHNNIKEASLLLSDIYGRKGDYRRALDYHRLYSEASDSLWQAAHSHKQQSHQLEKAHKNMLNEEKDSKFSTAMQKARNAELRAYVALIVVGLVAFFALMGLLLQYKANREQPKMITQRHTEDLEAKDKEISHLQHIIEGLRMRVSALEGKNGPKEP